ncbi:FliM/FliN family flagellar motor C-terminal domain-containing protein (plasmid) [Paracoccus sp. TK19116]|uniref:FliM/FliN family flagellar motor C-terminal domain-containing protein n=1 Tax=Paracoccus albicereus TaxID=2922394 RepID=A0ABT1MKQ0_9RHOB|nr:FliM/FliN family flagellar motor C-terminal domain-containing protein [Paracoccus albicereus]MCQ0968870.1 FliM/FliN family flagellar motor C-terminal domain-containing protein [Paracoccus albicereus]
MVDDSAAADGDATISGQHGVTSIQPSEGGVLRRLLRNRQNARMDAGEAPGMPQQVRRNPARAAATAIARAGEDLYGLPVQPLTVVPDGITLAEMAEILPDQALFAVVEGPQEALGVVALDPEAVTALIEVQALGRVTGRPVETRRRTRSDAMICAEFVNRALTELQAEIDGLEGFENYAGFRYASHLDDPRPLLLMLEDVNYRALRMRLRVGDDRARREIEIVVALPERRAIAALPSPVTATANGLAPAAQPAARAGATAPEKAASNASGPLAAQLQDAPIELLGVLCRRKISLGELRTLAPGRMIALPRVSLHDARLETRQGQVIAQGKLGEADGCHALRIRARAGSAAPLPEMPSFAIHDLAAPRLREAAGPVSAWQGGQRSGQEPPMGDLSRADAFRASTGDGAQIMPIEGGRSG